MSNYEICVSMMEPYNPRDEDHGNVGQIVTPTPYKYSWIGDYSLPVKDMLAVVDLYVRNNIPFAPVYVLDHSCIRVSTKTFNDPWDESHVGYILGDQRAYLKEIGGKRMSKNRRADLQARLELEISDLDDYYNVAHYEASIWDADGECVVNEIFFDTEEQAQEWAEDYIRDNLT